MYDLGLTPVDKRKFEDTLLRDHKINIRVEIMDLNHKYPRDVSDRVMEGQVDVEADAQITTRTLKMSLLDPEATLGFDTGDPSDGVLFLDRMIRARYEVYVPQITEPTKRWVSVPVFTGPVTKMDRTGAIVQLEAAGKEVLADNVWSSFNVKKNTNKYSAIRYIMAKAGETRFDLRYTTGKLPNELSMAFPKKFWVEARKIASSLNDYLYYDGTGRLIGKKRPSSSSYTFRDRGGSVLTDPAISYDPSVVRNVVRVVGRKPKKGKTPAYTYVAPSSHPLSPTSLGRNGIRRYLPERIQSDSYRTITACKSRAISYLESKLREIIEVKFDSLVIPHLEPNDTCTVVTKDMSVYFRLKSYSIPLTHSGVMTVGYRKSQTIYKKRIRRKPPQ